MALFLTARRSGRRFLERAEQDSGKPPGRARRFRSWFRRYGLLTVFIPALVPIPLPLKIFVISAGVLRQRLVPFLGVVLLARILRYGSEAYLGAQLGKYSIVYLRDHALALTGGAAALFVVLYVLLRASDRFRKPVAP